ncbi:MAG: hypothetical protein AVDCRST_MAG43-1606 [uncultured Thermomicrobiales bacterium]|uniref:Lipoprotein n=1 Tax=uncultured Thermomicrobiales bacterium TaxID=1645740 RepID=A0A6J4URE0_9BACT|nr:MAG: hypothetical protein AVDCRST_MAG43-1606 [uncultured Thermomicrobiales bacterium]
MRDAPKPFSSEWINAPAATRVRPRRLPRRSHHWLIAFFAKLPGERGLTFLVVLVLVFSSFWFAGPRGEAHVRSGSRVVADVPAAPRLTFGEPEPTARANISTEALTVNTAGNAGGEQDAVAPQLKLEPEAAEEEASTPNGLLPKNRILAFYGFPGNPDMGILGEYDMDRLLEELRKQAAEYEEADPSHPVLLAFEVIASVAQKDPQADGSYLQDTPSDVLDQYADFTRENGLLLFLDVQIGYRTVENEIKGLKPWLSQDHVHLALDPEFAMKKGQVPGVHIGSIDAKDVTFAQNWLVDLATEARITPRLLVVHQFKETMLTNKDRIAPVPGVQLIVDADGWGTPTEKLATYDFVNRTTHIEYDGVKLFYNQDVPLMTAEDVVNLDPSPLLVIYQ